MVNDKLSIVLLVSGTLVVCLHVTEGEAEEKKNCVEVQYQHCQPVRKLENLFPLKRSAWAIGSEKRWLQNHCTVIK